LSKFFLNLNDKLTFCENLAFVETFKREINTNNVKLNYLVISVTIAMASHCLVIALLSAFTSGGQLLCSASSPPFPLSFLNLYRK
jgi:hypothetical protein